MKKILLVYPFSKETNGLPELYKVRGLTYSHFDPFALFITSSLILCFSYMNYLGQGYFSDEGFHIPMVQAIIAEKWDDLPTNVTTPHYYHAFLAFFAQLPGLEAHQLQTLRTVQFALSALAIPIFYHLSKHFYHADSDLRTLTCLLSPIFLPFIGLVYTDTPALTLTLAMIACTLSGKHWLAALFGVLSLGIRQMGVIWACFCACWVILNFYYVQGGQALKLQNILKNLIPRLIPYCIIGGVFLAYILINGGAVAGDKRAHSVAFNPSNIYIWLIISFVLFFPLNIEYAKHHWKTVIETKWLWYFIPVMFIAYLYFFKITHVYNFGNTWWAHNKLLQFATGNIIIKILFFIPITWMALTYIRSALNSTKPWMLMLLLAFSIISFLPMPMVEFRYYMIALVLFILWRPHTSAFSSKATLIITIGMTAYTLHATAMRWFFP